MVIISISKTGTGVHSIEDHSWMTPAQIPQGFVRVPEPFSRDVKESRGWCDLELDGDGNLAGVTPLPKPEPEPGNGP